MSEAIQIVEVFGRKVWVEHDFTGSKYVMVQHDAPGSEPFCWCAFAYSYQYTDNATVNREAVEMAKRLGASEPIEFRFRDFRDQANPPAATTQAPPAAPRCDDFRSE